MNNAALQNAEKRLHTQTSHPILLGKTLTHLKHKSYSALEISSHDQSMNRNSAEAKNKAKQCTIHAHTSINMYDTHLYSAIQVYIDLEIYSVILATTHAMNKFKIK